MVDIKKIFINYFYFIWLLILVLDIFSLTTKVISAGTFVIVFIIFIAGYAAYGFWIKKKMYG